MTRQERESKIEELTRQLEEHEKAIAKLKEEIESVRTSGICQNCHGELQEDALFCPNCGERVIKKVTDNVDKDTCPQCGAHIDKDMKFCIKCGYKVGPDEEKTIIVTRSKSNDHQVEKKPKTIESEPIKVQQPETIEPEPVKMQKPEPVQQPKEERPRFCMNCGAELEEDSVFCFMCGAKVEE